MFINNYCLWRYRQTSKTRNMEPTFEDNYLISVIDNIDKKYEADNLWYYYDLLVNSPNAYNGYHNFRHMCHVTCELYDAGCYYNVDPETLLVMLLAGIFHDYGHTGVGLPGNLDSVNINRAITHLQIDILPKHAYLIPRIKTFIEVTEFPHKALMPNGDQLKHELLLAMRDADMSQSLFDVWIQQIIFGMGSEQGKSRDEMLQGQLPFLQKYLDFHSEWGKKRYYPMREKRIDEVNHIISNMSTHGRKK